MAAAVARDDEINERLRRRRMINCAPAARCALRAARVQTAKRRAARTFACLAVDVLRASV